ncbi:MAG: hypothetical protein ACYC1C_13550, partial [Chloroflexota bacterium]
MKTILTVLTLATTGVVVGFLAGYLIAIAVTLIRANHNLSRVADRLEAVDKNTAPLAQDLPSVHQ